MGITDDRDDIFDDDEEEIPYDFLDRDARRRRLAEKSEKENYRHKSQIFQQIEKEKRGMRYRTFLAVIAIAAAFMAAGLLYSRNYTMTTYSVDGEETQKGLSEARMTAFGEGTLVFFRDAVSYSENGTTVWTEYLSFTDPSFVQRGDYFAVFERGGINLQIFGKDGLLCTVSVNRPIRTADISASGVTAMVTETDEAAYISYFDRFGSRVSVELRALLSQTGYPMDIAISPDGQRLAVAYYSLASGLGESSLILYDFGQGRDSQGYVVGTLSDFSKTETLLLDVGFLSNDVLAVVGDDLLRMVSMKDSEVNVLSDRTLSERTKGVFFEAGCLAVAESGGSGVLLDIYGEGGSIVSSMSASCSYDEVRVGEKQVIFRDGSHFILMNRNGVLRYDGLLTEEPVTVCFCGKGGVLVNNGSVLRKITLK